MNTAQQGCLARLHVHDIGAQITYLGLIEDIVGAGIVLRPTVPVLQHAGHSDQCGTFIPEDDAPPVLVIGSRAAAEKIEALARRHGLSAGMLLAFARVGLAGAG